MTSFTLQDCSVRELSAAHTINGNLPTWAPAPGDVTISLKSSPIEGEKNQFHTQGVFRATPSHGGFSLQAGILSIFQITSDENVEDIISQVEENPDLLTRVMWPEARHAMAQVATGIGVLSGLPFLLPEDPASTLATDSNEANSD